MSMARRTPASAPLALDAAPRVLAARVLFAVAEGRSLDDALIGQAAGYPQMPLLRALVHTALRHAWSADALLAMLAKRAPRPRLRALLRAALCELRFLSTPAHAAVSESVAAARTLEAGAASFVNALLRRFLRERESLEARLGLDPEAVHEHPRWLIERFQADWPQDWEAICAAGNRQGPMWIRVDRRRLCREDYREQLAELGIHATLPERPGQGLLLVEPVAVDRLPGFADGLVSAQDGAAQRVVEVLAPAAGQRVLDACAAPGGKCAALLEAEPSLRMAALERDARRAALLRQTLARCRVDADVRVADAGQPAEWWDGEAFDRILIDAPCSGSGVISRHPDIKHLRRPGDIAALAGEQRRLLDRLWPLLARGGRLVYATCSVLAAENQAQIAAFLQRTPDARALPLDLPGWRACGDGWQRLPLEEAEAGFFYACLQRSG